MRKEIKSNQMKIFQESLSRLLFDLPRQTEIAEKIVGNVFRRYRRTMSERRLW